MSIIVEKIAEATFLLTAHSNFAVAAAPSSRIFASYNDLDGSWLKDAPCYEDDDEDHVDKEVDDYDASTSSMISSYEEFLKFAIHDVASMHEGTTGTNLRRVVSATALQDAAVDDDDDDHNEEETDDYVASTSSMISSY
jgi:hypothetical protein